MILLKTSSLFAKKQVFSWWLMISANFAIISNFSSSSKIRISPLIVSLCEIYVLTVSSLNCLVLIPSVDSLTKTIYCHPWSCNSPNIFFVTTSLSFTTLSQIASLYVRSNKTTGLLSSIWHVFLIKSALFPTEFMITPSVCSLKNDSIFLFSWSLLLSASAINNWQPLFLHSDCTPLISKEEKGLPISAIVNPIQFDLSDFKLCAARFGL